MLGTVIFHNLSLFHVTSQQIQTWRSDAPLQLSLFHGLANWIQLAKVFFRDVCIALRPPSLEIVWFVHPGGSVGSRLPWDASLGNTSELQMAEAGIDGIVRHRWHRL